MKTLLTLDDKLVLLENPEVVKAGSKVLTMIMDRHIEKLLSENVEQGQTARLLVLKAKLDGMKEMVREYEQFISKITRS